MTVSEGEDEIQGRIEYASTGTTDTTQAHWFDHSRDLLHMVNHFRKDMVGPLIGIGHSMVCPSGTLLYHLL